jgi:hypothetical protein
MSQIMLGSTKRRKKRKTVAGSTRNIVKENNFTEMEIGRAA